jgi:hypothetical protein
VIQGSGDVAAHEQPLVVVNWKNDPCDALVSVVLVGDSV